MKVKFFNQPFMVHVDEVDKVHGSVHDYLVLVVDDPLKSWHELVMVSKLKKIDHELYPDMEVFS